MAADGSIRDRIFRGRGNTRSLIGHYGERGGGRRPPDWFSKDGRPIRSRFPNERRPRRSLFDVCINGIRFFIHVHLPLPTQPSNKKRTIKKTKTKWKRNDRNGASK